MALAYPVEFDADRLARFLAPLSQCFTQRFAALPDIEMFFLKAAA